MAERKPTTMTEPDEPEMPVMALAEPEPVGAHGSYTPTLGDAFDALRHALATHYQDDNMPSYLQCQELGIIYTNGGSNPSHPNCVMAWRQIIGLLEQAIGAPLRTL